MIEGFGLALVDILLNVPGRITLNHKHVVNRQLFQIGGVIPTALLFLASLGITSRFHTALADDVFGRMVHRFLRHPRIQLDVIKKTGATPSAAVAVEPASGNRTGFYQLGVFQKLSGGDIDKIKFNSDSRYLLIDGHNFTASFSLIKKAKTGGIKVLLDLGTFKPQAEKLLELADVIFVPEAYRLAVLPNLNPGKTALALQKRGPRICVVTCGEKGSYIAQNQTVFCQPAVPVKAVDTNGAGDIFMAGFAYGLIKDWPLQKSAAFAAAAAAISCTKFGKIGSWSKSEKEIISLLSYFD